MSRPTGFTMDSSYVALDVDMWCPDVVVVSVSLLVCVCMCVCVCVCECGGGALVFWGGGGNACVSRDAFELQ